MSSPALETFLARLYTDAALRSRFLRQPVQEARRAGLSHEDALALCGIDRVGLQMAAHSYACKRAGRMRSYRVARWSRPWETLWRLCRRQSLRLVR
jgi:hypothetical protein